MNRLITLYWRICFFKADPGDIPYSIPLLVILLLMHVLVQNLLMVMGEYEALMLPATVANTLMMVLLSYTFLWISGNRTRTVQTVSALAGVDILIASVFLVPINLLVNNELVADGTMAGASLAVFVWGLFIAAHIISRAMNTSLFLGLAVAFTYVVAGSMSAQLILGLGKVGAGS